jgi:hypothetical protein
MHLNELLSNIEPGSFAWIAPVNSTVRATAPPDNFISLTVPDQHAM